MKRKVGDKVKIREDLVVGRYYGDTYFSRGMVYYPGYESEITIIGCSYYRLKGIDFRWSDEMLEDLDLKPSEQ